MEVTTNEVGATAILVLVILVAGEGAADIIATMQESDPTAESSARKERRWWKIAAIAAPFLGVLITVWVLWSSPDLAYTVDEEIHGQWRTVTIEIQNWGNAPSVNMYGWIEFPSGERPRSAVGPKEFEVQVGEVWKRLGRQTGLRSSEARVYIRNRHMQPGIRYTLTFVGEGKGLVDTGRSAKVHLVDDTGKARRSWW